MRFDIKSYDPKFFSILYLWLCKTMPVNKNCVIFLISNGIQNMREVVMTHGLKVKLMGIFFVFQ